MGSMSKTTINMKNKDEIEEKIKVLEKLLEPKPQTSKYNINNKIMTPSYEDDMNNIININIVNAKISALKWVLKKKRMI